VEDRVEDESCLLTLKTPVLDSFDSVGKKSLYLIYVFKSLTCDF